MTTQRERKLPWTYWVIVLIAQAGVMFVAALISATIGVNPYVGATLGGCAYALRETWVTARRDRHG